MLHQSVMSVVIHYAVNFQQIELNFETHLHVGQDFHDLFVNGVRPVSPEALFCALRKTLFLRLVQQ